MKSTCVCCGDCNPEGRGFCPGCEHRPQATHKITTKIDNKMTTRKSDKKTEICDYLREYHTGMGNAVFSRDLERLFDIDGRNLRRKISALRMAGVPICSGDMGYFFADNQQEINNTIGRLNGMVTKVSNSRNGLLRSHAEPVMRVEVTLRVDGGSCHGSI